jgi:hypothetical protein
MASKQFLDGHLRTDLDHGYIISLSMAKIFAIAQANEKKNRKYLVIALAPRCQNWMEKKLKKLSGNFS